MLLGNPMLEVGPTACAFVHTTMYTM